MISARFIPAALVLAALSAACSGGSPSPIPAAQSASVRASGSGHHLHIGVPPKAVDLGKSRPQAPVNVVVLLRYNHERALKHFVAELARSRRPRYLTHAQFVATYAPTAEQQKLVIEVLRKRGFSIEHTYRNRTILDVRGSAAAVGQFFSTDIHEFRQGRYGVHGAAVRPLRVPRALSSLVAAADANDVVTMRAAAGAATFLAGGAFPSGENAIGNSGFESGALHPWKSCTSSAGVPAAAVSTTHPHRGKYDAFAGTSNTKAGEIDGVAAVCQLVKIPAHATLGVWTYQVSNDSSKKVMQFGALYTAKGAVAKRLFAQNRTKGWTQQKFDLSAYAGKTYEIAFGVAGKGHAGKRIGQWIDDVTLAAAASPSPSPSASPTVAPNATPTPNYGPGGYTWGPASVADGFHMPANYGYTGEGQTAAVVIDSPVSPSDLSQYLSYFGIMQRGTFSNVNTPDCTSDYYGYGSYYYGYAPCSYIGTQPGGFEATLDVETIAGLAPGANVIDYVIPALASHFIEDGYNQILSDGKANVVNSSFGGCESQDSGYDTITDALAEQGAATGVTFSASSGDSGAQCYDGTYPFGVNAPASDPNFVAVGGTESHIFPVYSGLSITNPVVWNDPPNANSSFGAAGGGGVSTVWPLPAYQQGVSGVTATGRNVPDISLPATWDAIYIAIDGGWGGVDGTSWASPIYVAMQLEIDQACKSSAWGINQLYGAFGASQYAKDFLDVKNGNNQISGYSRGYYATAGFDDASGIGMPLGMPIAADACGVTER